MSSLTRIETSHVSALDKQTFADLGCAMHGVVVLKGAASWGAHERGSIELPTGEGKIVVPLAYDEREAPYALDEHGQEATNLLLSLTDENDYIACAWARVGDASPLMGVGVDLSSRSHFEERPIRSSGKPARDLSLLLFTENERSLVDTLVPKDSVYAKAALFAAKEAAFKATAAPLRRWYDTHSDELLFEVRHFVMEEPGIERGTGRNAAAQAAMDRMGIGQIIVRHTQVCGMALVTAVALAD